jgi:hypothetical protein
MEEGSVMEIETKFSLKQKVSGKTLSGNSISGSIVAVIRAEPETVYLVEERWENSRTLMLESELRATAADCM